MAMNKTAIVTYVPVIHAGYVKFFEKYPEADLVIVDKELIGDKFRSIQKDIRALEIEQIINSLRTLFPNRNIIHLRNKTDLGDYEQIIMPEDEISDWLQIEFFADKEVKHDSIFFTLE